MKEYKQYLLCYKDGRFSACVLDLFSFFIRYIISPIIDFIHQISSNLYLHASHITDIGDAVCGKLLVHLLVWQLIKAQGSTLVPLRKSTARQDSSKNGVLHPARCTGAVAARLPRIAFGIRTGDTTRSHQYGRQRRRHSRPAVVPHHHPQPISVGTFREFHGFPRRADGRIRLQ